VIVGGSILGPIGALLAVPVAAVLQAFVSTLGERHEVVETDLTQPPPEPRARRRQKRRG
jgi:predicted PurR-regulated permease PerM